MEVIVALAILGVGIAALVELGSITLRSTKKSSDYSTALIYARTLMEESYSEPKLSAVRETFSYEREFRAVREVASRTMEEEKEAGLSVYEITVTVTWPPSGGLSLKGTRAVVERE